jgi:hypothetical protein
MRLRNSLEMTAKKCADAQQQARAILQGGKPK